jgi:2-oxo-4-hydroxy-4-carboxy-5-ureidoimidazoline decarboxylase
MERWRDLDTAAPDAARAILRRACGSTAWVDRMLALRPFGSQGTLLSAARREWFALTEKDWLEAFAHHPKIGDRASLASRFPATHDLSAMEQSAVGLAQDGVLNALVEANEAYLDRFGFIFIVCATGKTGEQMLALLRGRLPNDRDTELRNAAEEQSKITALRLS